MLPLILLTFSVFLTLWIGDFYLTLKTTKKAGYRVEINPIMQIFFRVRRQYVWIFKLVELSIFFYLIYFLTSIAETTQFYMLLVYIIIYAILVANNSRVYYKITGKESLAINYILILVVIFTALFIYLNFFLYSNIKTSYNVLGQCKESFNNLYWSCQQKNATGGAKLPSDLEEVLKSLNLTISRP